MRAFGIRRYGSNNVVEVLEVPEPSLNPEDVLIRIKAASINPVDLKIRDGQLRRILPYKFPLLLGNDCSGVVEAVASSACAFKPGDEVYTRVDKDRIGTFADFIAVHQSAVARKPTNLSFEEAASIPLVGLTSWQALIVKGELEAGMKVFIAAGSGGVGSFAIQLARHFGATVATTTSSRNLDWVKGLGAREVIDYTREDFADQLHGFDLAFDTMGGDSQRKAFDILKRGGLLVSVVGPPTVEFAREFRLGPFVRIGSFFMSLKVNAICRSKGVRYVFLFMQPSGAQLDEITKLLESCAIKPNIDRVFPFSETKEGLAYVETGRARGKVVISSRITSQTL